MIKKLRRNFLLVSMAAFFLVVLLLLVALNLINYVQNEGNIDTMLYYLTEENGMFPEGGDLPHKYDAYSPETRYETRFFSVLFDQNGTVVETHLDAIAAISETTAEQFAREALERDRVSGYRGIYKYYITLEPDGSSLVVFLDCNAIKQSELYFLRSSILVMCISCLLVFLLLLLFSNWFIAPTVESMEKQKQFITDAGHELKTPLAIISANTEVLELTQGENEWTDSIHHQTERLSSLVQNLLTLSRLEELPKENQIAPVDLSRAVQEEAEPFLTLAQSKGKTLELEIPQGIGCRGNEKNLRQLVSILLDNAVKYAKDGGTIRLRLEESGKRIRLSVENPYPGASEKALKSVFGRFSRTDQSRARETGGYGIGLSIATAIVGSLRGRLTATVPEPDVVQFVAVWPK